MLPNKIEVTHKFIPKGYSTLEEAINAARDRVALGKTESKKIAGRTIKSYLYNGNELAIFFSNSKVLKIALSENLVTWELNDTSELMLLKKEVLPELFFLEYSDGCKEKWEWKKILDGLLGLEFRLIAPSDIFLWIYNCNYEDIMFSGLCLTSHKRDLLYFHLCEK